MVGIEACVRLGASDHATRKWEDAGIDPWRLLLKVM